MNEEEQSIHKMVKLVYEYEPENEVEENAFAELIGNPSMYRAIKVFKLARKPTEEVVKFIIKINLKFNIQDML